jgi:virginiamycin B lyase
LTRGFKVALVLAIFVLSLSAPLKPGSQVYSSSLRVLAPAQSSPTVLSDPIVEYKIPTPNAGPNAVVAGPNDTLWFVEFSAGKIGEFFIQNDSFHEFVIPEAGATPACLAIDSFGNVWFSDQHGSGSIWVFSPTTDQFKQFNTTTSDSTPLFILFDNHDNVWFTEITGNKIGELTYPNYIMTEYTFPTASSGPVEMAYQPNESLLWITQTYSGQLASFNMVTHVFQEYNPAVSMNSPVGIVLDKNGNVWISEHRGSAIIEFQVSSNLWRKYPTSVPPPYAAYPISAPATLAIASNGDLWFVEHFSNKIGKLDPATGSLEEFSIPNSGAYSVLNTIDSNGNFWFTQFAADALGFVPANASAPLSVSPQGSGIPTVDAGRLIYLNLTVQNIGNSVITFQLNASSSFSATGYTPSNQAGFAANLVTLNPGDAADITGGIIPPITLSSGTYSVGIVFTAGNYSVVQTVFIFVKGDPYLFLPSIQNYIEAILGATIVAFGCFYYFVVKKETLKLKN